MGVWGMEVPQGNTQKKNRNTLRDTQSDNWEYAKDIKFPLPYPKEDQRLQSGLIAPDMEISAEKVPTLNYQKTNSTSLAWRNECSIELRNIEVTNYENNFQKSEFKGNKLSGKVCDHHCKGL
ncbi:hypothetical protein CEXT_579831 [Caerostris extrusa]|uniref:Uncharacterized protein n=1 Tax=Caerostris extrusa TaxID=172846 RepID=A0AAV4WZV9_CAEEX|nr:hypothetical protein CEXT_579831 [Caerostris extrusa]